MKVTFTGVVDEVYNGDKGCYITFKVREPAECKGKVKIKFDAMPKGLQEDQRVTCTLLVQPRWSFQYGNSFRCIDVLEVK